MSMHTCDELSEEDLDRMERRVAAATVGPWLPESEEAKPATNVSVIELGCATSSAHSKSIELVGASAADTIHRQCQARHTATASGSARVACPAAIAQRRSRATHEKRR